MAARQFSEFNLTLLKKMVNIFCRVKVGAAGAITLQKWSYPAALASKAVGSYAAAPTTGVEYAVGNGEGVQSVLKNAGAGDWTITLSDPYQRLIQVGATFTAANGAAGALAVGINTTTTDVTKFTARGNGGLIRLTMLSSQGTAADPANGDVVDLNFTLHDSTIE